MLSTIDKGEEDHCMIALLSVYRLSIFYYISVDENRLMSKKGYFNFFYYLTEILLFSKPFNVMRKKITF